MPKLTRRTAVVELADGRIIETRILNPDTLRYEETAQRHGWPGMTVKDGVATLADTSRRATFEAFAALKRTGEYSGTWEQFSSTDCLEVDVDEEEVGPTQPAPVPDSSPSSHGTDAGPTTSSLEPTTS